MIEEENGKMVQQQTLQKEGSNCSTLEKTLKKPGKPYECFKDSPVKSFWTPAPWLGPGAATAGGATRVTRRTRRRRRPLRGGAKENPIVEQ